MDSTSHIFLRKTTDSSGNNKTGMEHILKKVMRWDMASK